MTDLVVEMDIETDPSEARSLLTGEALEHETLVRNTGMKCSLESFLADRVGG